MDNKQKIAHKPKRQLMVEYEERRTITLWNRPLTTSYYFLIECIYQVARLFHKTLRYKIVTCLSLLTLIGYCFLRGAPGPHQAAIVYLEKNVLWYSWWVFLGFLSSCGFGSGLHTFVLYLGPFIAQVTMSAYICQSLDFPEPPYPDLIICPSNSSVSTSGISFYSIIRKVQAEAMFWGLGTAIGELPPYFMARTSRLSGGIQDEEIELSSDFSPSSSDADGDSTPLAKKSEKEMTFVQNLELILQRLITRAGFIAILLCASVPNPLFDFAGMTCGHFLVPFSTFFGATLIGKAIIKTHIQTFFVILMSSQDHIEMMVYLLGKVPIFGTKLQHPFLEYLQNQKDKLLNKAVATKTSWIQSAVQMAVTLAMIVFAISLVNAMAQNCHRRMCQRGKIEVKIAEKNSFSRTEVANGGLKED
ncbi:unnamed protein product [Rodentolepis nana]|uniref:Transmembrane protein 49 n=1 Tax=Rodentolepis nana TaxID=102285 RepID=A0A0R3TP34_RODNA|nr:unnamed protein product [Rodentolepis nana]